MTLEAVNNVVQAARFVSAAATVVGVILSLGDPRVSIQQGPIRGTVLKSRTGSDIFAFQGIPYAAPPVGNLRFRAPQLAPAWTEEREAHSEGEKCLQSHLLLGIPEGHEDCLYLNVYTPQLKREGAGLPVMVWIHGGGFTSGAGDLDLYGPQLLLDHGVVLVTFNYRLGAFGFLSLGTKELSGNYGLKDQVMVLRWVQENIAKFSGNPDLVTIFGQSAGAASVHYLMLSPAARGLFHRAIMQSGSALNPWALERNATRTALGMTAALKCKKNKIEAVVSCLRMADANQVLEISKHIRAKMKKDLLFVPTLEPADSLGAILTEDPRTLMARGEVSSVPLLAGLTTHEGMLRLAGLESKSPAQDYQERQAHFHPSALGLSGDSLEWRHAWQAIEAFYRNISQGDFTEQYLLMYSDSEGVLGVDETVRGFAALRRNPVFYYQFSYEGGLAFYKMIMNIKRRGTAHGDEIGYLFSPLLPLWMVASPEDQMTINRMTKMWTDFAKIGNPTPGRALGVTWQPMEAPAGNPRLASTRYLDIGAQLVMKSENLNGERVAFWQHLLDHFQPHVRHRRRFLLTHKLL